MTTLYNINAEYAQLFAELELAETEEDVEAIWDAIAQIDEDATRQAESCAFLLRNLLADAEAYKAEKQRLEAKQRAAENAVERLKRLVGHTMELQGVSAIQTPIGKWRRQLNNPSVVVVDEAAIPAEFRVPQPDKIDRNGIIAYAKEHKDAKVPGAEVVRTEGIRFR